MPDDNAMLILKDVGQARTDMERFVCDILQSKGPKTVSDLVKRVADEMYYEELRNGAWAVDIVYGVLRSSTEMLWPSWMA